MGANQEIRKGAVDSGLSDDMVIVPDRNPSQSVHHSHPNESNERSYDLRKPSGISALISTDDEDLIKKEIDSYVSNIISSDEACKNYNVVFLFDISGSINRNHADCIYSAIQSFDEKKDIILFLRSRGGSVEPSFLISQLCNKHKDKKFIVAIPGEAKSAATLLSFGADEIHMGPMSELGPIDLQVDGLPLQSISGALEKIAGIVQKYPGSSDMFAKYLSEKLNIGLIGYYDRVSESASQYAQMLLRGKHDDNTRSVEEIATHFTNHYKDHGFVIDVEESKSILGSYMVKDNTDIYKVASKLLNFFNSIEMIYAIRGLKRNVVCVGKRCEIITDAPSKDRLHTKNIKA
ncbi:SDH family Clp fold serine proteinase [Escherichia coli]|uniref:SDH family Clp fold serine proteinase n=1 Tax=Escherichia coli TaxID=562 RepID=UPI001CBD4439|nr:ATP-dependent Clp protease proteolytic subunit [Escherichia coli]MCD9134051.1 ATP-dependent Clp protease proteolytic subunit [Escherichia coli]